jgi:hypothetical protein
MSGCEFLLLVGIPGLIRQFTDCFSVERNASVRLITRGLFSRYHASPGRHR